MIPLHCLTMGHALRNAPLADFITVQTLWSVPRQLPHHQMTEPVGALSYLHIDFEDHYAAQDCVMVETHQENAF